MQPKKGIETHDPEIADEFAYKWPKEVGAASACVRCGWVIEFETGMFHRCKMAYGHPGAHVYGTQILRRTDGGKFAAWYDSGEADGQATAVHV